MKVNLFSTNIQSFATNLPSSGVDSPQVETVVPSDTSSGVTAAGSLVTSTVSEPVLPPYRAIAGAPLGDYLSRPVLINTIVWNSSTPDHTVIDPWVLLLNNAFIQEKLIRYSRLRADLSLRVQVIGTPFTYGRMLCAYEHYNVPDVNRVYTLTAASVLPGANLDPCTNTVLEFTVPYLYPEPYINLTDAGGVALGKLHFHQINPVQLINSASGASATINVYASLANPTVDVTTTVPLPTFIAQSAPLQVSGFRKAVNAVSQSVSAALRIARNFPTPGRNFLWSDAPSSSEGMTLFSGSRLSPLGAFAPQAMADDLSVLGIASRWGYLEQFNWPTTSAINTKLWAFEVNPTYCPSTGSTGSNGNYYDLTPIAQASYPFAFWRGTIEYKIEIVGAAAHSGRLRITFDPMSVVTTINSATYTVLNSITLDISDTREFVFSVAHSVPEAWNTVGGFGAAGLPFTGGKLLFSVENQLASMLSTQDVNVNIYVRAGPDFEVAVPDMHKFNTDSYRFSLFNPQSADLAAQPLVASTTSKPPTSGFFGEVFTSFLPLMSRPTLWKYVVPPSTTASSDPAISAMNYILPFFPTPFASPHGWDVITGNNYSFSNTLIMSYLAPSFLGFRGSMSWVIADTTPDLENNQGVPTRYTFCGTGQYDALGTTPAVYQFIPDNLTSSKSARAFIVPPGSLDDALAISTLTTTSPLHGVTAITSPPYCSSLYRPLATEPNDMLDHLDGAWCVAVTSTAHPNVVTGNAFTGRMGHFVSAHAGPDFEFICYKSPPRVYVCTTIPASA